MDERESDDRKEDKSVGATNDTSVGSSGDNTTGLSPARKKQKTKKKIFPRKSENKWVLRRADNRNKTLDVETPASFEELKFFQLSRLKKHISRFEEDLDDF